MKSLKNILINENNKTSKYSIDDLKNAIDYLNEYYDNYPEERGNYPNWGEMDGFFENDEFCEALMDAEQDPLVEIVDEIWELFYKK